MRMRPYLKDFSIFVRSPNHIKIIISTKVRLLYLFISGSPRLIPLVETANPHLEYKSMSLRESHPCSWDQSTPLYASTFVRVGD